MPITRWQPFAKDNVTVECKDGVLRLTLHKASQAEENAAVKMKVA